MSALVVLAQGAGVGLGLVLTSWVLQSTRHLLEGILAKHFGDLGDDKPVDPRELEPEAWDHFAANAIAAGKDPADAAAIADELMAERRRRYNRSVNP